MKRSKFTILNLIVILLLTSHCSNIKNRFQPVALKNPRIAVLDFEQEGFVIGAKFENLAADQLTTALYLLQKLAVVDRAQVQGKFN